ncbi:uncharacterized protein LOC141608663 isoform X3 [Silene latifolia]|uniref:uncharacterized protein LOC141608663 isoform X3 n=1 Tax=Silene latifolia TaxID=37657 RepID=UPI003D779725
MESCSLRFFIAKIVISDLVISDTYFSGKNKGKKKRDSVIDAAKDYQIPPDVMSLQCYVCLAEGLSMILAAVRNELNVFQHASPFNTEYEIFIQHFEHLQKALFIILIADNFLGYAKY